MCFEIKLTSTCLDFMNDTIQEILIHWHPHNLRGSADRQICQGNISGFVNVANQSMGLIGFHYIVFLFKGYVYYLAAHWQDLIKIVYDFTSNFHLEWLF